MSLLDKIKRDAQRITSNGDEYAVDITFISPELTTVTIKGIHAKRHLPVFTDGNQINTKTAYVSISEAILSAAGYTVRNSKTEVSLVGHRANVADSTGISKEYVIQETYPDETLGLIVCILGDYE